MRIVIAGAGSVGRSIALELLSNKHEVLLIDKASDAMRVSQVSHASWLLGDACELSILEEAQADTADVIVAATGDDQANLVISLLAKTEFGVPKTVARVSNPLNEWLFDDAWGVDVAISTPRVMTAIVEEAVSVGDLVPVFTFNRSKAQILEMTLPHDSGLIGNLTSSLDYPQGVILSSIVRDGSPFFPEQGDTFEGGDELFFLAESSVNISDVSDYLKQYTVLAAEVDLPDAELY